MFNTLRKLKALLDPHDYRKVFLLLFIMIVTAFMQTAGVASVMPFLAVLSNPEVIDTNVWLNTVFQYLNYESKESFLHFLSVAAFLIFVSATALQALKQWAMVRFAQMQQYELSRRLMADYLRRPYSFFLNRNSGDLAKNVLQETAQAINGGLMPAMRLTSQILLASAMVTLLVAIYPNLAIIVAVTLGSIYGLIYLLAKTWLTKIGKDRVLANRDRFTAAAEAFAGAKEIRLLGREFDYLERYAKPSKRFAKHQANAAVLQNIPRYAIEALAFGGIMLVVLYLMGSKGSIDKVLPIIGVYALAGRQLIPAFQDIFSSVAQLRFSAPAVDNILADLGGEEGSIQLPKRLQKFDPLVPVEKIELVNVTYRYPECEEPALKALNLSIQANSTVGFVGPSGAGKSTLVDLLLGLLPPEEGDILIDDQPLVDNNRRHWQAAIGYVPQHIFLADQSVAANIALGLPESQIDREAVERASRLANLHEFVLSELPNGYDTIIGERGVRLSGGQRQRIGIARALYRDPAVIFFDEATSALDNATERAVMDAIHNLSGRKTILLVAHRLSTVKPCDCINVLVKGVLVEQGHWNQLICQKGSQFEKLASNDT
ncbi:ABC transporter ATP-binding protein [Lamprobacter modestohalophilus]|uniref:ABC transporter ATP-binding protein n=1 Tax=Lamprobacter modestohalophilus TaxID=1064514 RepID=UPI002ADEC864|nr:ABC transporter ATP-binding protein [Lamprobacter modestohalophilus]MEA1050961.1 ABC transporter ATP-binding protein [Lamprobacter modestohalophilus]